MFTLSDMSILPVYDRVTPTKQHMIQFVPFAAKDHVDTTLFLLFLKSHVANVAMKIEIFTSNLMLHLQLVIHKKALV